MDSLHVNDLPAGMERSTFIEEIVHYIKLTQL